MVLIGMDPPSLEESDDTVVVPECPCPLTEVQLDELSTTIFPLSPSQNYGIDIYQSVLQSLIKHYQTLCVAHQCLL